MVKSNICIFNGWLSGSNAVRRVAAPPAPSEGWRAVHGSHTRIYLFIFITGSRFHLFYGKFFEGEKLCRMVVLTLPYTVKTGMYINTYGTIPRTYHPKIQTKYVVHTYV